MTGLQDGGWLSTTAIDELLRRIPCQTATIYDAAYMKVADPQLMSRKTSRKWPDTLCFFPTNHNDNHWTLIVTDPSVAETSFYNSLPHCSYELEAEAAISNWPPLASGETNAVDRRKWTFHARDCPLQTNTSDCGISVVVCAIAHVLKTTLASSVDFDVWRQVFRAVLADSLPASERPAYITGASTQHTSSLIDEQDATTLDAAGALKTELDSNEVVLNAVRQKHAMTIDISNILTALLAEIEECSRSSISKREKHQKALNDYTTLFDTFKTIDTQHQSVRHALETCLDEERRAVLKEEKRQQWLSQSQRGWEAGMAACLGEQRSQRESLNSTKAVMVKLLGHLEVVEKRLFEEARSAKEMRLEWKEKVNGW